MVCEQTCSCGNEMDKHVKNAWHVRSYCDVGNTAQHCRLGLFQGSDFAGDFEDSKSTSGGILCIFGSHTFVPISLMCKKLTSVSHSSPFGNFTRDEWNNLLHLFNISHFRSTCCAKNSSLISCPRTMAKRMQKEKGEERSVVKSNLQRWTCLPMFRQVPHPRKVRLHP